jgi:lipoprotein-releasing system ATP-binding protein
MSEPVLRCEGLGKRFTEGGLDVPVLQGVALEVARGRTRGHRGRLGLGQEHAAAPAGRAGRAQRGRRQLMGRDLATLGPAEQGAWRNRHLGFVYQFHHLLPEFTALDNVAMPLLIRRAAAASAQARRARHAAPRWAWRTGWTTARRAVRRRTPARGHRPRAGDAAGLRAGRRAHRQPRPQHRRRRVRADAAAQRAARSARRRQARIRCQRQTPSTVT